MNVLWVSHFVLFPDTGFGALQRSRNLLKAVARENQVHLIALCRGAEWTPAKLAAAEQDLKTVCASVLIVKEEHSSAKTLLRSLLNGTPYSTELFRSTALNSAIESALTSKAIDLIHADTLGLCETLLAYFDIPIALTHHNVESLMMRRRADREKSPLKKLFFLFESRKLAAFERRFCPLFALHIAVSAADADALRSACRSAPVIIVENPVDCDYWQPRSSVPANCELLFCGGLDWYPNLDAVNFFCAEVWPLLERKYPELTFTIVGRDCPSAPVAQSLGTDRIRFAGFVDDVRPYFSRARLFVCPMRDGGGTKLKVVDAFAAGIPLVSTSFGTFGLEVSDGVHALVADTPQEFAAAVERLLQNEALCASLSANGRSLVEQRYSARALGKRLNDAYLGLTEYRGKLPS